MIARVLVTGGSGFLGSWVLRELIDRGAEPVVYDLNENQPVWQSILGEHATKVHFVSGNLTDREKLHQTCADGITHVIHLAALLTPACQADPWLACQVNVLGTVNVFEGIRKLAKNISGFSYASSLAVFGPKPTEYQGNVKDETHSPSFYGAYKRCTELIANQYWRHFQIASVGIRPHVIFGPERRDGLTAGVSLAARAAALGESHTINYSGAATYDYVEDVALAFVRSALETPRGAHVVDLPGDKATPQEIVAQLAEQLPHAAGKLHVDGPDIPSNIPAQKTLISDIFSDWQATSLAEGLRKTTEFYLSRAQ